MLSVLHAALLTASVLACPAPAGQAAVVATADGVAIPRTLFEMYVRNGVDALGIDRHSADARAKLTELERAILDELIDRALVEAEARRRGLAVESTLPTRRAQWIARMGGEAGFRAYLAEHALTPQEFDRAIVQEVAGELLRDAITREIRISDEDVAAFYGRERDNPAFASLFVQPETVTASHILIAARPSLVGPGELARRRARAEEIRRRVLAGADFAALAREVSEDPGTREAGGDLGAFTRDTHVDAFDAAAFALAPGQVSEVVQTEFGFHVIRVTAKSPRRVRTIAEVRPAIEAQLLEKRSAEHLRRWLEHRRRQAAIDVKPAANNQH